MCNNISNEAVLLSNLTRNGEWVLLYVIFIYFAFITRSSTKAQTNSADFIIISWYYALNL